MCINYLFTPIKEKETKINGVDKCSKRTVFILVYRIRRFLSTDYNYSLKIFSCRRCVKS